MDILSFIIRIHLNTPDQMDAILARIDDLFCFIIGKGIIMVGNGHGA